jgi:thiol-disulfide isomerase/thioredoxin
MKPTHLLKTLGLLLLMSQATFGQGIKFQKGEWRDVLREARLFRKTIFIDIYTTWCTPCKIMDKDVFSQGAVGTKYNDNFICYKVDAEKGEGIILAKKFGVSSFPTLLYVDAEENIIQKREGAMPLADFMNEADMVVASLKEGGKPLGTWDKEYTDGRRDAEFLYSYINKRTKFGNDNRQLLEEYLYTLPNAMLTQERVLRLILNNVFDADNKAYEVLCANRDKVETFMANGEQKVNSAIAASVGESFKVVQQNKDEQALERLLEKNTSCLPDVAERMNARYRTLFYQSVKNVPLFIKNSTEYFDNFLMYQQIESVRKQDEWEYEVIMHPYRTGAKDSTKRREEYDLFKRYARNVNARQSANEIMKLVKSYVEMVEDPATLRKSITWMERAIELSESTEIQNTMAQLWNRIGDKGKAVAAQERAIWLANQDKQDTAQLLAELERMK